MLQKETLAALIAAVNKMEPEYFENTMPGDVILKLNDGIPEDSLEAYLCASHTQTELKVMLNLLIA